MFQWDKSITTLDLAVGKVVHLFRSMRDVQLALPGLPAQEASAYLCQYRTSKGVGTAVVFHLHKSGQLAFYVNTPKESTIDKADAMLDQATVFVESMGFLMSDLDIHLLSESDREMLWSSLPLRKGIEPAEKSQGTKTSPVSSESVAPPALQSVGQPARIGSVAALPETSVESKSLRETESVAAVEEPFERPTATTAVDGDKGSQGNVDDLLAAVEALRTRRPGVRARKKPPSLEELKRRRQELRENIGHILASL